MDSNNTRKRFVVPSLEKVEQANSNNANIVSKSIENVMHGQAKPTTTQQKANSEPQPQPQPQPQLETSANSSAGYTSSSKGNPSTSTPSGISKNIGIDLTPTKTYSTSSIIVNPVQRDNPVLKYIQNVPYEFDETLADYVIGRSSCVLYLSLKYHHLYPEYIHSRIEKLGDNYDLRILLILVDSTEYEATIHELTLATMYNRITIVLCWSFDEAGRYLESLKSQEFRPPDLIKERVEPDFMSQVTSFLTSIKPINKSDVLTLISKYRSVSNICKASEKDLALLPGFGEHKAKVLKQALTESFVLFSDEKETT